MSTPTAPAQASEQTLIAQALTGNRDAFSDLVLLHYQGTINVVYRMCGDLALAEDVAQEAFIRVWEKLDTYRPVGSFRSWVYRIAVNAALDTLRRQKETLYMDAIDLPAEGKSVEEIVSHRQQADTVRRAVMALPLASRSVLVLREYEGLSYQEIANTLDIPVGTVMSRLNYARTALKSALSEHLEVS